MNGNSPPERQCLAAPDQKQTGRFKAAVGKICFSPLILPLILLSLLASRLFLYAPVQSALLQLGEKLAGRPLNPEPWGIRFYRWGWTGLICSIPAFLSWLVMFIYCKIRRIRTFDWALIFIALGLWIFFSLCVIPVERTRHLATYLAALVLGIPFILAVSRAQSRSCDAGRPRMLLLLALSVLTALFLAAIFIDKGHTWGDDFSEYIAQAQVLATGQDSPGRPQVGYKYGTALLLLPFFKAWGLNLIALKIPMVLCFAAFIAVAALFYGKRVGIGQAAAATFLLATNPVLISFLNNVLSEIPFLLFSTLTLACFYEVYEKKNGRGRQCLWATAAGFCTMYAYSCRFQGLVLLLTFVSTEILLLLRAVCRKNRFIQSWTDRLAGSGIPAHLCFYAAFAISYILYALLLPPSPARSDLDFLRGFSLKGLAYNAIFYPIFFNDFFNCHGHCPRIICIALYLASLPPIVLGILKKAKEEAICLIYSFGLLAVYIIWPGPQDFRFLFPILPFMILFAVYGFGELEESSIKKCYTAFSIFIVCTFFCCILHEGLITLRHKRSGDYQAFSHMAQESYAYIREHTGADERILFFKPRVLYLATGRPCAEFSKGIPASQLAEFDYILIFDAPEAPEANPGIALPQGLSLEEAFSNAKFKLYRIVKLDANQ